MISYYILSEKEEKKIGVGVSRAEAIKNLKKIFHHISDDDIVISKRKLQYVSSIINYRVFSVIGYVARRKEDCSFINTAKAGKLEV